MKTKRAQVLILATAGILAAKADMPNNPPAAYAATPAVLKMVASPIHLRSRTYVPLESSLMTTEQAMDALRNNDLDRLHVLVQFERMPSMAALANQGVRVLNLVLKDTVVISMPATMRARELPNIRWIGLLEWEDKIDDSASAVFCLSPTYASTEHVHASAEKPYLIHAFSDVPANILESIVQRAGGLVDPHPDLPDHMRIAWAFPEVVRAMAKDSRIAWITAAEGNLIQKEAVAHCPGVLTAYGPVAEFATIMTNDFAASAHSTKDTRSSYTGADVGKIQTDGTFGSNGWDGPGFGSAILDYYFGLRTSDVSGEETEVRNALSTWSEYVLVSFTETGTARKSRSLDFNWFPNQSSSHPIGYPDTAFNRTSSGTIFAHAFPPPDSTTFLVSEPLAGDVHFNNDKTWTKGNTPDVFTEALHEIGHSLGLEHSSSSTDVMGDPHPTLVDDLRPNDISRIRLLYASTAPGGPMSPPFSLFVNPCGCFGGAHTKWGSSSGATKYQLFRSPVNNPSQKTMLYEGTRTGQHIEIPSPGPQSLWVRACNSAGCSGFTKGNKSATYSQGCF